MRTIKPATRDNAIQLNNAIALMKKARGWLRGADSPKALEALQAALKSAEGAKRHMQHRLNRANPPGLRAPGVDHMPG
ncbi:hypothetical protein [Bradyrhizobium embrapense]|uniref:hypothetical protein n=1 Tax=Bradyrhizobium embrapense TaxID=630921 RepID=UPI000A873547|nr:hypothetical protein [Bradyrhizobium embrapense]